MQPMKKLLNGFSRKPSYLVAFLDSCPCTRSTPTRSTSQEINFPGDQLQVFIVISQEQGLFNFRHGQQHEALEVDRINGYFNSIWMKGQYKFKSIVSGTNNHLKGWHSQKNKIGGKALQFEARAMQPPQQKEVCPRR